MKNLVVWDLSRKHLNSLSSDEYQVCRGHEEDNQEIGAIYVFTSNLIVTYFDEEGKVRWEKDLSGIASPDNSPVNITYLSLQHKVSVGLENGELYTIFDGGRTSELTGHVNAGLLAMEWSPEQELLICVTKVLSIVIVSCSYNHVKEVKLFSEEFGEKEFVNVGWGKKETQFHGRSGKQAAKVNNDISADPYSTIDETIKITWRGDGQLFAIGYPEDGIRRFKIYDREGNLQYTSEKQQGLEANLSWRPSGNVIATTQLNEDKYFVSFFEKNGLKHGEFKINVGPNMKVVNIAWSNDSEILSLQCKDTVTGSQQLLLYTTANYHWYLKQTLKFNPQQQISRIMWDCAFDVFHNKRLYVFLQNGELYTYDWVWVTNHSNGKSETDDAVVAVIDDKKLLVTGFRQTVVPPPMAAFVLSVDDHIDSLHFAPAIHAPNINPNSFFITTASQKIIFYAQTQKNPLQYKLQRIIPLDKYEFPYQCYNWYWVNAETIICIMLDTEYSYDLMEFSLQENDMKLQHTCRMPSSVTRIQTHPNKSDTVFIQLDSGELISYTLGGDIDPQDVYFQKACPQFNVIDVEDNLHFIGLTHKGTLHIDNAREINSVSSIFFHTHFLLITTLTHELVCAELTESGINAMKVFHSAPELVYKRRIERGAKLVIVVPCDNRTVLQMPRGNLEVIQPRPLSLKIIGEYLDLSKYFEAFNLMRKQRINLNLIYDHDPENFNKNIDKFLESIKNTSWLNLFLSDLENSDVTKTMYNNSYVGKPEKQKQDVDTKILKVCDLVRDNINSRKDRDAKILPIITTFVKKNTVVELEKALLIIKELKLKESGGSKLPVGSDEALKYLLYMVDVNQLFDVALGMYDFDLALLIATKSQKDPKEYIPMLNEFNDMDENYKRYTINKHLKRFDNAVECLVKCGSSRHAELRTFVKYHSLYREALALLSSHDEVFKEISDDYGLHLKLKKQHTQAGIVYERANSIEKAVHCYTDALQWELALNLALSNQWTKEQVKTLCGELVSQLKEEKRHQEALVIMERFYENCEETIEYAIECSQYKTVLRLCAQHQKNHLKDEKLLPALLGDYEIIKEAIESHWSTFIRQRERLLVVRDIKAKNPPEIYDYNQKDSDLYSDIGSTIASSSRGSTKSRQSSKNRRKHERKMASLKEGSQYEDVALVMALHKLVTISHDMRLQVREIVIALSHFEKGREALLIQNSLAKLLKEMKDSFKAIWTNEFLMEATNALIAALDVPEGTDVTIQGIAALSPHLRIAPVIQEVNWKLDGLD